MTQPGLILVQQIPGPPGAPGTNCNVSVNGNPPVHPRPQINFIPVGCTVVLADNPTEGVGGATDVTITVVPAVTGWQTILDLDFSAQSNQTISADGPVTIGGQVFSKFGTAKETAAMAVVAGTGLVLQPIGLSFYLNGSVATTFPGLQLFLSALTFPQAIEWDQRLRLWVYFKTEGFNDGSSQLSGLDVAGATGNYGQYFARQQTASQAQFASKMAQAGSSASSCTGTSIQASLSAANRVVVNEFRIAPLGDRLTYIGAFGTGAWPDLGACTPVYTVHNTGVPVDVSSLLVGITPGQLGVFVGACDGGGGGFTVNPTIGRIRLDWRP
jgi:hypothetical protein